LERGKKLNYHPRGPDRIGELRRGRRKAMKDVAYGGKARGRKKGKHQERKGVENYARPQSGGF